MTPTKSLGSPRRIPYTVLIAALLALGYKAQQRLRTTNTVIMPEPKWQFSAQRGFFTHDNDIADWTFRATTQPSLGLVDRPYPTDEESNGGTTRDSSSRAQWSRFRTYIKSLNSEDPENKQYKLFYIVRHGQGVHNVKETEVGRDEWNVRLGSTSSAMLSD